SLSVLLIDDENVIRSALATILGLEEDLRVVAEGGTAADGIALIREYTSDTAVVSLQLLAGAGLGVCAEIAMSCPATCCLILSSHARPGYLKRALEQGILGFLP